MLFCKLRFHFKFHLWFYAFVLVPISHKCACLEGYQGVSLEEEEETFCYRQFKAGPFDSKSRM